MNGPLASLALPGRTNSARCRAPSWGRSGGIRRCLLQCVVVALTLAPRFTAAADFATLRAIDAAGDNGTWENAFTAELRSGDAAAAATLEQNLIAVAVDAKATSYGRRLACRLLRHCATERAAAALAPLLAEPDMADPVRLVLEGIESPVADLALIAGLGKSDGETRRGIIASLAARGTGQAFVPLMELASRGDEPTALAALRALGLVAREARDVNSIAALPLPNTDSILVAQQEAFFTAISRLAARKVNLDEVVIPFPKMQARTPEVADLAVGVMLRTNPAQAVSQIVAMFQAGDPDYQRRAAQALGLLPDAAARVELLNHVAELPANVVPMVVEGLARRGAAEVLPLARQLISGDNDAARAAAIAAIGELGDSSDVPALLKLAAGDTEASRTAISALGQLPDRKVDALLVAEFARADSPVRDALPGIFATRAMRDTVPALLTAAPTAPRKLSEESYRAIGELGSQENIAVLRQQWSAADAASRPPIERAIVGIGRHSAAGAVTAALTSTYAKGNPDTQASIIRMVTGIGDAPALEFLKGLVGGKKPNEAALRALAGWRGDDAVPILAAAIRAGHLSASLRSEAWEGMVRMARGAMRRWPGSALPIMDECLALAQTDAERERVVGLIGDRIGDDLLAWLTRWSTDAKVGPFATKLRNAMKKRLDEVA